MTIIGHRKGLGKVSRGLAADLPPIPGASTIASFTVGDGSITIVVTGDAGATNELWYRTPGGTWTKGNSRVGNGSITQTGLVNGTIYEVCCRAQLSGVYGPPSNTIFAMPNTSSDGMPFSQIAAYVFAARDRLLASTAFLAWIQSVNGTETTAGHVTLGFDPKHLGNAAVKGPYALLRFENAHGSNAGSSKAFKAYVDVVIDFIFAVGTDPTHANQFNREMGYLSKIISELIRDSGNDFDGTYGKRGSIAAWSAADALTQDPKQDTIRHSELRLTIEYGHMDDGT